MHIGKFILIVAFLLLGLVVKPTISIAQDYSFDWAKGIVASGGDSNISDDVMGGGHPGRIATDKFGNVYVTGGYNCDSADFDPGPGTHYLYNANAASSSSFFINTNIFVFKLDAGGGLVWAKSMDGIGAAEGLGSAVTTDTAGNVYIVGSFTGTIDFDPGPNTAPLTSQGNDTAFDVFVCKLDADGNYVWARSLGGAGKDLGNDIAVDASGNLYIAGEFTGTVDFDPGPDTVGLTSNGGEDAFLWKLTPDGDFVWAKSWGASGLDWAGSVDVDAAGNVYSTGVFWFTVDFDPGPNSVNLSAGTYAAFVLKLDTSGDFVWAKVPRGGTSAGYSLAAGQTGVYVTGTFYGNVDFDPGSNTAFLNSNASSDIFIWKLDTAGGYAWGKGIGGPGEGDWGTGIAVDAVDNVYTLAHFEDSVDFDPGPGTANLISRGNKDIAILKLDPSGNYLWSGSMGSRSTEYATVGIAVSSGNIYAGATFYTDTIDADPTSGYFPIAPYQGGSFPGGVTITKLLCNDTSFVELTVDTCAGYTLGGETYIESGTYVQTLSGVLGCDSTVTLHLTITPLDPVITVDEFVLGTVAGGYDSYQWLLNGVPISGATDSVYTVLENGDYQVVVTGNSCTDTSVIYEVNNVGISALDDFGRFVRIYPNPAADIVYIQSAFPVNVTLMSLEGRVLREVKQAESVSVSDLAAGVYLLKIANAQSEGQTVERLVVKPK